MDCEDITYEHVVNGKVSVVKKEKKKDTRTTWFETNTATIPR